MNYSDLKINSDKTLSIGILVKILVEIKDNLPDDIKGRIYFNTNFIEKSFILDNQIRTFSLHKQSCSASMYCDFHNNFSCNINSVLEYILRYAPTNKIIVINMSIKNFVGCSHTVNYEIAYGWVVV